ncbi:MFS transporter [Nocardia sp. NPDC051832]|uniref:MFS transporter n=1 Tax=Nocardia sp. NPDC051832 TaxID=3155673 RepID=UPI003444DA74
MVRRIDAALFSLWLIFFLNGAVLSSWAPRIPDVKHDLHLSDGVLGLALFGVAAGSVPALFATGALLRRAPARAVCLLSAVVFAAALPSIALAHNGFTLGLTLAVLGAASGCLDVAMNALGIRFEERRGARVLSRLHGGYSLGVLAGAGAGGLAAHFDVSVGRHFSVVAAALIAVALSVSRRLPSYGPPRPDAAPPAGRRVPRIPWQIAALAVAALLLEGMVTDWSALLVGRDYGGDTSLGAFAITGFSFAMFLSRSLGDALVERFGARRLCVAGAAIAVLTMAAGLAQPSPTGLLIAIMAMSLVLGPLFPLAVSAAGLAGPADAAAMAAKVSAVGYLAYLGGPPLVGLGAETLSLPVTFAITTLICGIAMALSGRRLPSAEHRAEQLERGKITWPN